MILLLAALLLSSSVAAVDVESEQIERFGLDELTLPDEAAGLLPELSPAEPSDFGESLSRLLANGLSHTGEALRAAIRTAVSMTAVVVLCSMCSQMEDRRNIALLAGTLAITLLGVGNFRSMVALGRDALEELRSFSLLLLPALSAATVASGGLTAGGAVSAAAIFVSDVLMSLINGLLIPLLYAFLALAAANAVLGNQTLAKLRDLIKSLLTGGLKLAVFAFTGYISLSGLISGASDGAAVRAAKLALSATVPVVGGMISDASETVLVSARMLRNAAGVFGMLAVLAICLLPLLRLGVQMLVLKLTAALCATVAEKPLVGVIESVSDALGFLMAMTAASGFMLLISCVAFLKAVSV